VQIRQFKKNLPIKNYIDPKALYKRERKLLKLYLKEIKNLKLRLKGDFGEEYI
jgi:signal-transduction protein with cAMP-binding, CBS, and nucleotidyltransferase domain